MHRIPARNPLTPSRPARLKLAAIGLLALILAGCQTDSERNHAFVNTPVIISQLVGKWERDPDSTGEYKQWYRFNVEGSGRMQASPNVPDTDMTYRVEGRRLLIQYYFDDKIPNNWRTRTLIYEYEINGDRLTLTDVNDGAIQRWRRLARPTR